MANLYGSSNHPVEIKKIALKIWRLRDEVEAVIRERAKNLAEGQTQIKTEDLYREYHSIKAGAPNLIVLDGGGPADPEGEDEFSQMMADAIENPETAEAEDGDESAADSEEATDSEQQEMAEGEESAQTAEGENSEEADVDAAAAAAAMLEGQGEENPPTSEATTTSVPTTAKIRFRKPDMTGKIYDGVTMLADLNMLDICFFSKTAFLPGQTVIIEMQVTKKFSCSAEVLTCMNYNMHSRVISSKRPPYRIHAKFVYLREGERTLMRDFCRSIEPDIPAEVAKPKVQQEDDEDDFDDLEDLGL